jgi:hypothetical protein
VIVKFHTFAQNDLREFLMQAIGDDLVVAM